MQKNVYNFYSTYEEAKKAAIRLSVKTKKEYRLRCCTEDTKLPYAPRIVYKEKGWVNWYDFLGKKNPLEFYSTYAEAKKATKELGVKTIREYFKHYKENKRLVSEPSYYYKNKGWIGWHNFFDKARLYSTYEEAKRATKRLGINSSIEYFARHKEYPKLPYKPNIKYKNKGWTNWYDFLEKKREKM